MAKFGIDSPATRTRMIAVSAKLVALDRGEDPRERADRQRERQRGERQDRADREGCPSGRSETGMWT